MKIKKFTERFYNLLRVSRLPLFLILLFVVQSNFFQLWLKMPLQTYMVRRSVISAALAVLVFGPAILFRKHVKFIYLLILSLFVSLIFSFQFLYYSYSGGFLQVSALLYAGEGKTVIATIQTLLTYRLLLFFAGPFVVVLAWVLTSKGLLAEKILSNRTKVLAGIFIMFFSVAGYSYVFAKEYLEEGNTDQIFRYSRLYNVNDLVSKLGIINFTLGDALVLGLHTDSVTAADKNFAEKFISEQPKASAGQDFGLLKGRNLFFIQVESLENAVINQKIDGQEITPNLNKLAKDGLYFSNYYSPIGPGTTADAEFMTLNSLYSLPDTVAFVQYAYDHYEALPGLLKDNGYGTYAFHGDVPSFWNRANIYPQLGYEKWYGRNDYNIPRNIGVYDLGDEDFFDQSIPKLKSLPRPFMATLITLTSHTPFQIPSDLKTLKYSSTSSLNWLQQEYLQSIRYTDKAIGDFIDQLKAAGLYDNSLIFIYGDHGSFTNISSALGVKESVFADLQSTQVPLIMLAPGTSLKGTRTTPGSHLDLYPTAADLLGLSPPTSTFGRDIVDGKNTIAVSRNLVSGTVSSFISESLAYHMGSDGVFEHGTCLELPSKKKIDVNSCRAIYDQEDQAVQASDSLVKGDLLNKNK